MIVIATWVNEASRNIERVNIAAKSSFSLRMISKKVKAIKFAEKNIELV